MNIIHKKIILFSLLIFAGFGSLKAEKTFGKTFFSQRPVVSDRARLDAGIAPLQNLCDMDYVYGTFAITPAYSRTFNSNDIGTYFFFNGTNTMTFGAAGASGVDVFARNFFLNDDFNGQVTALPSIENVIVDFDFYLGLDEWVPHLYFRIHTPINWTKWNFNLEESVISGGTTIAANAFGNTTALASPVTSLIQAYNGQTLNTTEFPDLKAVLGNDRVNGAQSKTQLADIELEVGYNFICKECAYLGLSLRTIFPAGNRPNSQFLFEPVAGNGHHYEFGCGVIGYYEFWNNCNSSLGAYLDGSLYHVFNAKQRRIFDLTANGVGSHNLLIKRFSSPTNYGQEMLYGPNVLTLDCNVRNDIHSDVAVWLNYCRCGFTVDLGYNLWARTKDKIQIIGVIPDDTYALAGQTLGTGSATADNTGSTARINGTGGAPDAVNTFITTADLNPESAATPTSISHKLFTHVGYIWENCEYLPFFGVGGAAEFSGKQNNALNQWTVWAKGGFAFS